MEKAYWFYSCNGKKTEMFLITIAFFFSCESISVLFLSVRFMFSQVEKMNIICMNSGIKLIQN